MSGLVLEVQIHRLQGEDLKVTMSRCSLRRFLLTSAILLRSGGGERHLDLRSRRCQETDQPYHPYREQQACMRAGDDWLLFRDR
eukprot:746545-Hanusia_phi.AAC.2